MTDRDDREAYQGLSWDEPGVLTQALDEIEKEWREYQELLDHSERKGWPDDPDDDIPF